MYTVIIIMTIGMIIGFFIRNINEKKNIAKPLNYIISGLIFLLLFFLGILVGTNETIINNLDIIGIKALVLTIGAVCGSIFVSYFTYKFFFKER